ncbi:GNAT family N-acetyltransferase [Gammaproteobacteria bacterium]|nr:GNAT family N-acetyltransferase [Gammaproteobacteria bacterium]
MSVNVRLGKLEDQIRCSELLDVLTEATSEQNEIFDSDTFSELISNERGSLVIAEENGIILGMASVSFNLALRYNGEYCQLEELVVDQDARGKNVGGLLIEESLRLAKERGCKEFGLYLLESTKHNQPFYEKYGFVYIGEEMRQYL